MKSVSILVFLLCTMISQLGWSQCTLPNGDFSEWEDATELLMDDFGIQPDTTLFLPLDWAPFIRPFSLGFAFGLLPITDSIAFANNFFGVQRYTVDEAGQDFALCLQPDSFLNVADLVTFNICEEEPSSIKMRIKYEGTGSDTLTLLYAQGDVDVSTIAIDDTITDPAQSGLSAFLVQDIVGVSEEWMEVEFPVELIEDALDNPEIPDTSILWLLAQGDSTNLANGGSVKFCIDDISLEFESTSVPLRITEKQVKVFPNPATHQVWLQSVEHRVLSYEIFDMASRRIATYPGFNGIQKQSIESLTPGMYMLKIHSESGMEIHKLLKQ